FFFSSRRRHTRFSRDWSSDVCSSDLGLILNKKGTTWRKLSEEEQQTALASQTNLINALTTHSSLIKRPVLETASGYIIGFDEKRSEERRVGKECRSSMEM